MALHRQLRDFPHVKIYAYIETNNYRYWLAPAERANYIRAQIQAVRDTGIRVSMGWYAWSPQNKYGVLFSVLRNSKK